VVPVVTGEFGEDKCGDTFDLAFMPWADQHGISYLGWAWDATDEGWDCSVGPALIEDYGGKPTAYGVALKEALGQASQTSQAGQAGQAGQVVGMSPLRLNPEQLPRDIRIGFGGGESGIKHFTLRAMNQCSVCAKLTVHTVEHLDFWVTQF